MPPDEDALAKRAGNLFREGRLEAARDVYRQLLDGNPSRADDWVDFGLLLRRVGQFEEALSAYDTALSHDVARPEEVHLNRAVILVDDLADPDRALAALQACLSLNPDYVPGLLNLGNLHEDRGARDAAATAYARALELDPGNVLALTRLADVTQFEKGDHPLIDRLAEALADPATLPMDRADTGFALGRALDQCQDYAAAFAAYRLANEAIRSLARQPYNPKGSAAFIDRIIDVFGEVPPEESTGYEAPIFICGMFRSGSTLVERILSAHSEIRAGGELAILPRLVTDQLAPYPDTLRGQDRSANTQLRDQYLAELDRMSLPHSGLTDKRPDNFLHVGLIKRIFPSAKIVLTRRDAMDNCLSVYFAHLAPHLTYASSLESVGHWYRQYERLAAHWLRLFPDDVHVADYDALVASPEAEIGKMLDFLNLGWEESCLNPHAGEGQVRTASAWQVREPLYTRSSGRWRNYGGFLDPLRKSLMNS